MIIHAPAETFGLTLSFRALRLHPSSNTPVFACDDADHNGSPARVRTGRAGAGAMVDSDLLRFQVASTLMLQRFSWHANVAKAALVSRGEAEGAEKEASKFRPAPLLA
jgi:hypothetical protein